jgi:hypothetical protein
MQGLFRVLLYLYDCYVRLGVEGDDEKRKKRELSTPPVVDDEQNLLDAIVEHGARKSEEREFVLQQCAECCREGILCRSLSL